MGVTSQHGFCSVAYVHLRGTSSEVHRARHPNFGGCGNLRHLDDSAAVCVRAEFSGGEVPAGAGAELAAHGEARVGAGGRRRRAQWLVVVAQLVYVFGGWCWPAWNGFSGEAFRNLCGFFRLSLASAVMLW